jgi:vitamin B12 transporter
MISETGTKLRSSIGTGAKSPSLYQRFSQYGSLTLRPEENIGFDIGIDQDFLNKRVQSNTTAFETRYRNMIDWSTTNCTSEQLTNPNIGGCYVNVDQARTRGVEQTLLFSLVPDLWRLKTSYTFMLAENQTTHLALLKRPQHQAMTSVTYLGFNKVEVEPRLTFVGHRLDYGQVPVKPYAKLDLLTSYKIDDTYMAYIRAENLTNAHYEDVRGYGTAGRSVYVGLRATW